MTQLILIDFQLPNNTRDEETQNLKILYNEFRKNISERPKKSFSTNFNNYSVLQVPEEPLDLVISYKYSLLIVSCMGNSHPNQSIYDDVIIAFDLYSRKLVAYLESKIKINCLSLEMNYDGKQNEALIYVKNDKLCKFDLKSLIDLSKGCDLGSTNTSSLAPIWEFQTVKKFFGMCIDYGNSRYDITRSSSEDIEKRKLYVAEDEKIYLFSAYDGKLITKIHCADAWGIRINSNGDLLYSLFYKGVIELVKSSNVELSKLTSDLEYGIGDDESTNIYASGIAIDPINGNVICAFYHLIVVFTQDGREISRTRTTHAQGCILDEKTGTLYVALNGSLSIGIYN